MSNALKLRKGSETQASTRVFAVLLAILVVVPALPVSNYIISVLVLTFVYAIFASSWGFLYGYSGQLSFGQAFMFGIGAFACAIMVGQLGIAPELSLFLGALIAMLFGVAMSVILLRMSGVYWAIATLLFAEIAEILAVKVWGEEGISRIPQLLGGSFIANYYFALGLLVACIVALYKITNGGIGLRLRATREDEMAARMGGINTTTLKVLACALSSFIAGLAGGYNSLWLMHTDYEAFDVVLTFQAISMAIVGGVTSVIGPTLGTFILYAPIEILNIVVPGPLRLMIYALIIMFVLRFLPGGLAVPVRRFFREIRSGKRHEDNRRQTPTAGS